jgi:hypothetical protein
MLATALIIGSKLAVYYHKRIHLQSFISVSMKNETLLAEEGVLVLVPVHWL